MGDRSTVAQEDCYGPMMLSIDRRIMGVWVSQDTLSLVHWQPICGRGPSWSNPRPPHARNAGNVVEEEY